MLTDNEVQFRLLLSSSFRRRIMSETQNASGEVIPGIGRIPQAKLWLTARLRISDAIEQFSDHYYKRTFSVLRSDFGSESADIIDSYIEFCSRQSQVWIDVDGASFYKYIWEKFRNTAETRLLKVAAIEYLLGVLSSSFNNQVLGDDSCGFDVDTAQGTAFLLVLDKHDFDSFSGMNSRFLPETGVLLASTSASRDILWASLPPDSIPQSSESIVHSAPRALVDLIMSNTRELLDVRASLC